MYYICRRFFFSYRGWVGRLVLFVMKFEVKIKFGCVDLVFLVEKVVWGFWV